MMQDGNTREDLKNFVSLVNALIVDPKNTYLKLMGTSGAISLSAFFKSSRSLCVLS